MIEVRDLSVGFGAALAVRNVDLSIAPGERIGIVGESGCGKSMLASALMGMAPDGATVTGSIRIAGAEMNGASERAWRARRGRDIAIIFQDPMAALNPLRRIGQTIAEPMMVHDGLSRQAARARVLDLLAEVGIPEPERRLRQFPHELSGGQRQRVLIALALAGNPSVLIADEPTTALDAKIAAQVIDLLVGLTRSRQLALVFISHDLGAVARATERMIVMYGGDMVERGATGDVLARPLHPYCQGLVAARPTIDVERPRRMRLTTIAGTVPALGALPVGCRFSGRCPIELPECAAVRPPATTHGDSRSALCHALAGAPASVARTPRTAVEHVS